MKRRYIAASFKKLVTEVILEELMLLKEFSQEFQELRQNILNKRIEKGKNPESTRCGRVIGEHERKQYKKNKQIQREAKLGVEMAIEQVRIIKVYQAQKAV